MLRPLQVEEDTNIIYVVAVQHRQNRQMWALGLKLGDDVKVVTGFRLDVKESTLKWAKRFIKRGEAYEAVGRLGWSQPTDGFQVSSI